MWVDLAGSAFRPAIYRPPASSEVGMCTALEGNPAVLRYLPCNTTLPSLVEGACPVARLPPPAAPPPGKAMQGCRDAGMHAGLQLIARPWPTPMGNQ